VISTTLLASTAILGAALEGTDIADGCSVLLLLLLLLLQLPPQLLGPSVLLAAS
jgi:hypothetical protein